MTQFIPYLQTVGVVATAPAFLPTDLSGLVIWLDAADPAVFTYSSGVVVSQWNDKSGNANHVAQGTVALQPSRSGTINSRSSVVYADDVMAAVTGAPSWTFLHNGTQHTVFVVGVAASVGTSLFPAYLGTTTGVGVGPGMDLLVFRSSGDIRHGITNSAIDVGVVNNQASVAITVDVPVLMEVQADPANATAAARSTIVTGASYANNTATQASAAGSPPSSLAVGGRSATDTSTRLSGQIAEVVIYNRALTAGERSQVRTYLQAKWAV